MADSLKPTVRIIVKSGPCFALTVKEDDRTVILTPFNPNKESHFWIKEWTSPPVQDPEGVRSFMLVNKASGLAIKRSNQDQPLSVVPYDPKVIDVNLLWSEAPDSSGDYKSIRTILDMNLRFDAQNAETNVQDPTSVVLWPAKPADQRNNQLWKIEDYPAPSSKPTFRIYSKDNPKFSLAVKDNKVVLQEPNKNDERQHWFKIDNDNVKGTFSLINKSTLEAMKSPLGNLELVQLVRYDANLSEDKSILLSHTTSGEYGGLFPANASNRHFQVRGGKAGANAAVEVHNDAFQNINYEVFGIAQY